MDITTSFDSAVISSSQKKTSAYEIRGSALEQLTNYSNKGSAIIINDVTTIDKDIALPVVATDNVRVLFKFGQDFGTVVINGRAYLGAKDCGDQQLIGVIQKAFDQSRLAKVNTPTKVSIAGSKAYPVYPVELKISETQAVTNSVGFSIVCILAPPSA